MRELEYPFDSEKLIRKKIKYKKLLLEKVDDNCVCVRIAILGGSTTNDIKDMLELFLLNVGIKPTFYESEYNQFYEDGMFDNPELVEFNPEIIYVHTSNRNIEMWPLVSDDNVTVDSKLKGVYDRFRGYWDHLIEKYNCPIIQNNFEMPYYRLLGNQDACIYTGRMSFVSRLNELLYAYCREHENFFVHDINYESALYGLEEWANPFYWYMYKYAMCTAAIPYTSYGVSNIVKSILGKNKKILALDLDNTLWGGVIGDDGAENIEIGQETSVGQAYSEFQKYIKEQKQIGVLLSVVSKNEDDIASKGFDRPDSILKKDDFVSFKANWSPKDRNIVDIADEINLLPESFVFVDDNPAEREIARRSICGIAIPQIGNPEQSIKAIDRAGYFEVTRISSDDLNRNKMYEANAKRRQAQVSFTDYKDYLLSLEMNATIKPFEDIYMSRIAQLTNKSNQFNLTTKRLTQPEIEKIADSDDYITLYGKLEDKFGDNGVVSVVIGAIKEHVLHIELWLMSCRVLKRDMEYAMLDELVKICLEKGITELKGYYYPTAKNKMVKEFYKGQGFSKLSEDEEGNSIWSLNLEDGYSNMNNVIKVN